MDQKNNILLQKVRSYRGVLSAGMQLYISAFRRFFKASWMTALIYALINAALGTLTAIKVPELIVVIQLQLQRFNGIFIESLQSYLVVLAECILLILAAVIAMAVAHGTIYALLKEHSETGDIPTPASWWKPSTRMMGRTLKGVLLTLLVCIHIFIVIPFALPMWFVQTKYIMETPTGF